MNTRKENRSMRINGETIIESLKVIQKVCSDNFSEENGNCSRCPFEIDGVCGIIDLFPMSWKISEYKKFKALE